MWMLDKYFEIKLSRKRIEKHLRAIEDCKNEILNKSPLVCAVQREIHPVKRIEDYIDTIAGFVRKAALQGCDLIAFPEYNFLDLMGMAPGLKQTEDYSFGTEDDNYSKLRALLHSTSDMISRSIEFIMSSLAVKYGIYIYTGSYFVIEDGRLYSTGSLISREGKIIGSQKKLHSSDFDKRMGLSCGASLEVFDTDIGKISCPVGVDGDYFETFKLLEAKSCDIAVLPTASSGKYGLYKALKGAWLRAQESGIYIIKPSLNGSLAGMQFTGRAGIFAPLDVMEGCEAANYSKQFEGSCLVTAPLDLDRLKEWRERDEYFGDRNESFESSYFEKTYLKGR